MGVFIQVIKFLDFALFIVFVGGASLSSCKGTYQDYKVGVIVRSKGRGSAKQKASLSFGKSTCHHRGI